MSKSSHPDADVDANVNQSSDAKRHFQRSEHIRPLKLCEVDAAGRVAALAFEHNPSYQFVFRTLVHDRERFLEALAWFLAARMSLAMTTKGGRVMVFERDGEVC